VGTVIVRMAIVVDEVIPSDKMSARQVRRLGNKLPILMLTSVNRALGIRLCDLLGKLKELNRKVFVVHDFDKSGFSIVATLRRGTRGSHGTGDVVDLGFRLEDIKGLERERVVYQSDPRPNLEQNGATEEEIAILHHGSRVGERVELNAMTSDQFIAWLERKLKKHGVKKLVPDRQTLAAAYQRAVFLQRMKEEGNKLRKKISGQAISVPANLERSVRKELKGSPDLSWDEAIWRLAENGNG